MAEMCATAYPRYGQACYLHLTEIEQTLTFDDTTAWQVALYQDDADQIVIQKCSQVGATTWAINDLILNLRQGRSGIYVLPSDRAMYNFVKNRIDPVINTVPYYKRHYATRKQDSSGSELKTLFGRRVKFAGSNVRTNFYETPAEWYIIDELDLCNQVNLHYLEDRLGRAKNKVRRKMGNPTIEKRGIASEFKASDQKEWFVRCGRCGERQPLTWWENVVRQIAPNRFVLRDRKVQNELNRIFRTEENENVALGILTARFEQQRIDARIYCRRCHRPMDRHGAGEWVKKAQDRPASGYHINKIFGDPYPPAILNVYRKQLESHNDQELRQRWYNNDLGETYADEGARMTEPLLDQAVRDYEMPAGLPSQILQRDFIRASAGVDVGTRLHVHVSGLILVNWKIYRCKLFIGSLGDQIDDDAFQQLHRICERYNIGSGVIDAMPETRLARKFCREHPGWYIAWYNKERSKQAFLRDDKKKEISLNRTEALDASLAAWKEGLVYLPLNWRNLDGGDFVTQMKNPVRYWDPGPEAFVWSKGDDHHRHTDTYEFYASQLPGAAVVS